MKKMLSIVFVIVIACSLSSCAIHSGLTGNMNNNTTNVVLQKNNYKIIQKVKGTAKGTSVFGFGGSFQPLIERARAEMLESVRLTGTSRAIINETVEVNNKNYALIVNQKEVTVSAYVIEFTE
ncbi:MAG: hypothetical protein LBL13_01910 [Bacteroidales bacterium]|jgi:hypothetical protein|nr:hypothetical protein [Bacteroidales bacterium]